MAREVIIEDGWSDVTLRCTITVDGLHTLSQYYLMQIGIQHSSLLIFNKA